MTSPGREPVRTLAIATAALGAIALWLVYGPAIAARWASGASEAVAEALFTVVMFGPLLVLALAGGAASGIAAWRPGPRAARASAVGLAIGMTGLLLATGYAALAGTVQRGSGSGISLAILMGIAVVALQVAAEEAFFRGWLQPLFARVIRVPVAIVATALAFATLHLLAGASGAVALLNLTLGGLLFGILAAQGGGIAGAFAAHFAWNATEQLGLGLDPNPVVGSFGALFDLDLVGPARWGGSGDGLNASWAMTIALAALLAPMIVLLSAKRRDGATARLRVCLGEIEAS